jgi:uncharacterized protein YeaO (DUF488 family)
MCSGARQGTSRGGSNIGDHLQSLALKRAYEPAEPSDGLRALVERLWPRGLSKAHAHIDVWLKDVAPSTELRKWYGHEPARFAEFRRRYEAELAAEPARAALTRLRELVEREHVTLVFAARDPNLSNATVLRDLLRGEQHGSLQESGSESAPRNR